MSTLAVVLANATEEETAAITAALGRANAKPAVIATMRDRRRYVVAQEDEAEFAELVGLRGEALADRVQYARGGFGGQWLRGYGRVDEMYRSLSMREVTKVATADRARVWGP
jgi:hypothetical protein